jgi:exonuclease VII large subunit
MFEMFIPPAAILAIGYAVIRRVRRPNAAGRSPAPPPPSAPSMAVRSWRDAARESDTLRIAVDQMVDHCDLAQQSVDAWLTAANANIREPQMFRRNVLEANAMMVQLDEECAAVVEELRNLERNRDRAGAYDERRAQAEAFVGWAQRQEASLRERLRKVAETANQDLGTLREEAAKRSPIRAGAALDALLPQFSHEHPVPLRSLVK